MKKILYLITSLCVLMSCHSKKKDGASAPLLPVTVAHPRVMDAELSKTYPGYLASVLSADIVGRVNGTLLEQYFEAGDVVEKGQALYLIEPTVYQDQVAQAQAELATAQSALDYAITHSERVLQARKSNAVSEIQVLQAQDNLNQARANLRRAQAALRTAKTNLGYCKVRAPFTGSISYSIHSVGNYVSGEASPFKLTEIYKDDQMEVYFSISEQEWAQLMQNGERSKRPLSHVEVLVGKEDPLRYPAELNFLSPNVDTSTGTLTLRGVLDNPKRQLKNGMYVDVKLPYGVAQDAICVSPSSIGFDQLGHFVYVVDDQGKVEYRSVQVGQLLGDSLQQLTQGLASDEQYVTKALMKVRAGMKVKPVMKGTSSTHP